MAVFKQLKTNKFKYRNNENVFDEKFLAKTKEIFSLDVLIPYEAGGWY